MRLSQAYIPTQKEIPADAIIPSHQLMLRAGLIRQLAAGVYSYLPFGWRIMKKVITIIREEMDRIGAQELQLPALNPVELWDETGRNEDFGDEIFRLNDRKKRQLVLAPTHEEVICDLARKYIRSYKDMPQMWYQIQTKFRDEPRPRSGVLRTRQFIMKDSYTITADEKGLAEAYDLHASAYHAIFQRCGLKYHVVGASSGLMGGSGSQEFMVESEFGEDTLVFCDSCNNAANMEVATSKSETVLTESQPLDKILTPEKKTIEEVSKFLKIEKNRLMKSLLYFCDDKPVMVLIRGDHEVNESKLQAVLGSPFRPAHPEEIETLCGTEAGFVGPVNLAKPISIIADLVIQKQKNLITGANEKDYHFSGIELDRDVSDFTTADVRNVVDGETCTSCSGTLNVVHAIELGHIFKLGTKYSERMNACYLDKEGKSKPIVMGSYGIGVERIIAAIIEQNSDKNGIVWDFNLNPYQVHIVPVNSENEQITKTATAVYNLLTENGFEVLIDDRSASPGFKFKEADLLGVPIQIIVGKKFLNDGQLEIKTRKDGNTFWVTQSEILKTVKNFFQKHTGF